MTTRTRLTPGRRLARGLTYTAVGPLDITRGTVGLGLHTAKSVGGGLRRHYSNAHIGEEVSAAQEAAARQLSAAQEAVAGLPQAFGGVRRPNRRRRRLIIFSAATFVTLAAGTVAFWVLRRSSEPEPSRRPPSVELTPRP